MPTPHIPIDSTTTSLHQSCPPEFETTQSHDTSNGTERAGAGDQGIIDDYVSDKSATSVKIGLDGTEEDDFVFESSVSAIATIEPEIKTEDQYSYSMPKDLGFALTTDTAITFSDLSALRVCKLTHVSAIVTDERNRDDQLTHHRSFVQVVNLLERRQTRRYTTLKFR